MITEISELLNIIEEQDRCIDKLALIILRSGLTIPEDLNTELSKLAKRVAEYAKD